MASMQTNLPDDEDGPDSARDWIVGAALRLIDEGGVAALTTRAVAQAAGVQAPTLYRLFGDKRGLLNAVAEQGMGRFVAEKMAVQPHPDPVQDLRDAWDHYIDFGLANPAVFAIMNEIGSPMAQSPASVTGLKVLHRRVHRIAHAGRLKITEDRAVALIHAAGVGTVSTLLALPAKERGSLHVDAREAVFAAILTEPAEGQSNAIAPLAIGLSAHLDEETRLTGGERLLLLELLERLADKPTSPEA